MKLLQLHVHLATHVNMSCRTPASTRSIASGWVPMLTALMHACTGKMGTMKSVVKELEEVEDKAKTFGWKWFKGYRGGVLVVSLTRLHKVMHTVHVVARVRCATPYTCT